MPESTYRIDPALPARVAKCVASVGNDVVWFAGGPVRDALWREFWPARTIDQRTEVDFDFATTVRPEQMVERLGSAADSRTGDLALGAVTAQCEPGISVTFTTLRRDGPYPVDSRRPTTVQFVEDLAIDAARRDFTINALYARVVDGVVLDPLGVGVRDLRARRLAAIGEPGARLFEDPLRILRAVRFASCFDLHLDSATEAACRRFVGRIDDIVPPSRRFEELDGALRGGAIGARALRWMRGLAVPIAAGLAMGRLSRDFEPLETLAADADRISRWSAVLLGTCAEVSTLAALQAPRELVRAVGDVLAGFEATRTLGEAGAAAQRACARAPEFAIRVELLRAFSDADPGFVPNRDRFENAVARVDTTRLVTGRDALAMGVIPGVEVGRVLAEVERLLGPDSDRERALAILSEVVAATPIKPPPGRRR